MSGWAAVSLPSSRGYATLCQFVFLTWFWGTHLANPSFRDYVIDPGQDSNELSSASLNGEESSPFGGLILEGLTEDDAKFFRDLHIQLRVNYRTKKAAQTLAAKLASADMPLPNNPAHRAT